MHYLITGGAGFIGSHLCERLLADGHRVTVLDNLSTGKRTHLPGSITFIEGDITTPGIFDTLIKPVDGCFHLAAVASVQLSEEDWLRTHRVNLGGTVALFDAIARSARKTPVVYASSAAVYGDSPAMPLSETSPCLPRSSYGVDKYGCELQGRVGSIIHAIPNIGLRFFNVYGERQDPNSPYSGVISIFGQRMKAHAPVIIHGDGEQARDFIYVGDVVTAMTMAMQKLRGKTITQGIYNVCTGRETSVNALKTLIQSATDSRSSVTHGPARGGDPRVSVGDGSLCQSQLGFSAKTSLADGLKSTLATL